ncbi:hypothetical protein DXF93_11720 [Escherichia coli]|nr:hypothetical protein DXF93_11720 [Escherichia coli]
MRGVSAGFFDLDRLTLWQQHAADVTAYFGLSDERTWGMTFSRLMWWISQAQRISKLRGKPPDE